jgi:hypothetical protein
MLSQNIVNKMYLHNLDVTVAATNGTKVKLLSTNGCYCAQRGAETSSVLCNCSEKESMTHCLVSKDIKQVKKYTINKGKRCQL